MKKLFSAFCAFAFSSLYLISTQAMDLYNFRNLGFSPDGQFYAYANTVVKDGSGFPHASVYVLDVSKNAIVSSASLTIQDDSSYEESEALRRVLLTMDLAAFKIYPGHNLGEDHALIKRNDHEVAFDTDSNDYALELSEKDAVNAVKAACSSPNKASKTFRLKLLDVYSQKEVLLADESFQPQARECSYGYKIEKVTHQGRSLVVVISYQVPGFEGPDTNYTVVTGRLP